MLKEAHIEILKVMTGTRPKFYYFLCLFAYTKTADLLFTFFKDFFTQTHVADIGKDFFLGHAGVVTALDG